MFVFTDMVSIINLEEMSDKCNVKVYLLGNKVNRRFGETYVLHLQHEADSKLAIVDYSLLGYPAV
jgi:hypothetical protein